jgi:hypothetical protein
MLYRKKTGLLLTIIAGLILVFCKPIFAQVAAEALPVPMNTEEENRQQRRVGEVYIETVFYKSDSSVREVGDFYRVRLPYLGWQEQNFSGLKDSGIKLDPSVINVLKDNLFFEKGQETIVITFMPDRSSLKGTTLYTLSKIVKKPEETPESAEGFSFELLNKPQKDVAPVYPGASLVNLNEKPGLQEATYFTKDDLGAADSFYKTKMPGYGWFIIEETPVEKVEMGGNSNKRSEYCPRCPKAPEGEFGATEMVTKKLIFSNQNQDKCSVVLSRVKMGDALTAAGVIANFTTILVIYAEKK